MVPMKDRRITLLIAIVHGLTSALLTGGCDNSEKSVTATIPAPVVKEATPAPVAPTPEIIIEPAVISEPPQTQFNIGNKSYLFDVSNHSIEEMEALLARAREISQFDSNEYKDLDIVMILHGPDIDWFTQQNQEKNMKLIELAAELDQLEIIDMKVCETAMDKRGIKREDIPAFIESVPYAPDEMKKLLQDGFINL